MSNQNTLSGFALSLASLYRDVEVAKSQSQLNAMTDTSAPGAEKVPDTEAAIGYVGQIQASVAENRNILMAGVLVVFAIGGAIMLSR